MLIEFASFENLQSDNAPACDSEECKLNALCMRKGQTLNYLWKS